MANPLAAAAGIAASSYRDPLWNPHADRYDDHGRAIDAERYPYLIVFDRVAIETTVGARLPDPTTRVDVHNVLPGSISGGGAGMTMCGLSLEQLYREVGADRYRAATFADGRTTCGRCGLLSAHRARATR